MNIDLYGLRIFSQVVEDKTFSGAARSLGITQPTVSQQIAKLETELKAKLFERVGHDIHLTRLGRDFLAFTNEILEKAKGLSEALHDNQSLPSGTVRYAMPESCQWTPHYRRIMAQMREFPEIRFEIGILPNDRIVKALLTGELDFGFTVGERLNPELRFEKFSEERYSAVASKTDYFSSFSGAASEKLRLISFPGWELFFTTWAKAHGLWDGLKNRMPRPTVEIGTLAGAIHAVQEGAGAAVIPTHCVSDELAGRRLKEFTPKKSANAFNPVHIAHRRGESLPRRVELVLSLLKKTKTAR